MEPRTQLPGRTGENRGLLHLNFIQEDQVKNCVRDELVEGTAYGILTAGLAYLIVHFMGFNPRTLPLLLYIYVVSAVIINMKAEIEQLSLPYLRRLVVVAEGEEMKLKRILTGEEYRVNGDVEKL